MEPKTIEDLKYELKERDYGISLKDRMIQKLQRDNDELWNLNKRIFRQLQIDTVIFYILVIPVAIMLSQLFSR
jgi:hypothetical protein